MKTPPFCLTILLSTISITTTAGTENLKAEESHTADLSKGAVLLSFDDLFVSQWMAAAKIFEECDAHATFFVMQPDRLSRQQIADLTRLHEAGHSIGCHSMRHRKAVDFAKKHGIEKYMEAEITPAMQALKAAGLSPTAFSYPNSQRNTETDEALLKVFRHLRTSIGIEITKEKRLKDVDSIFIPANKVAQIGCLCGINIDYTDTVKRPDDYFEQICEAMQRAKSRGEVVVLYGHNISDNGPGHYLRPKVLRKILAHAKKIGLPAIGYDELP
jgi:peptidoglycan/xylan/chitin deacetylase (PgdA/CDA1 family)